MLSYSSLKGDFVMKELRLTSFNTIVGDDFNEMFVDKLNDINLDDLDDNQQQYLVELVEFLRIWLINHILKLDKKIPCK